VTDQLCRTRDVLTDAFNMNPVRKGYSLRTMSEKLCAVSEVPVCRPLTSRAHGPAPAQHRLLCGVDPDEQNNG